MMYKLAVSERSIFSGSSKRNWAKDLCLTLLTNFGLPHWKFEFVDGKRRLGRAICPNRTSAGIIQVSSQFVELNNEIVIEDVIRHEIAHAIAYVRHGEAGHGPAWREACKLTGASPRACSTALYGKWRASCPD